MCEKKAPKPLLRNCLRNKKLKFFQEPTCLGWDINRAHSLAVQAMGKREEIPGKAT